MIRPNGYLFDTTTGYSGPPLYLGDREHFSKVMELAEDRLYVAKPVFGRASNKWTRSEEHTSELQSRFDLVCRLLLEKKKKYNLRIIIYYILNNKLFLQHLVMHKQHF